jgi:hypothetical protein
VKLGPQYGTQVVPSVFVRRCRVCGAEIETPWGPETHSQSEDALRNHLDHHSFSDLRAYAFREHLGSGGKK